MNYNPQKPCPCQSQLIFSECCQKILIDHSQAQQAIQVLRARFSAYFLKNATYIERSMAKAAKQDFDLSETKKWINQTKFIKLNIIKTSQGEATDELGWIEYKATIIHNHKVSVIHEISCFEKINQEWLYTDQINDWQAVQA